MRCNRSKGIFLHMSIFLKSASEQFRVFSRKQHMSSLLSNSRRWGRVWGNCHSPPPPGTYVLTRSILVKSRFEHSSDSNSNNSKCCKKSCLLSPILLVKPPPTRIAGVATDTTHLVFPKSKSKSKSISIYRFVRDLQYYIQHSIWGTDWPNYMYNVRSQQIDAD